MNWPSPDKLHRTAKALIDAGKAQDPEDAQRILKDLVLQVAVGASIIDDPAGQTALVTVVNTAQRCFLGGVHVRLESNPMLAIPWARGISAADAVAMYGGSVVDKLSITRPTLAVCHPKASDGRLVLHLGMRGWTAFVSDRPPDVSGKEAINLTGVTAGALGVAEMFQHETGNVVAGRRSLGVSLWRPDLPWTDPDAFGPTLSYLPSKLWLLGLGHLGQAYAWALGSVPFPTPEQVCIGLVDFDRVVEGNTATQLLVREADVGRRKTRVVADALEQIGLQTQVVERALDQHFTPDLLRHEPTVALAGFDKPEPRRALGDHRFTRVVDGGLGAGPVEYLDILLHTFPSSEDPAEVFKPRGGRIVQLADAYEKEIARQVASGQGEAAARCGMLDLAGVSVGAAFVGAFAGSMVVADILRHLHNGTEFSVVAIDLRNPCDLQAVTNAASGEFAGIDFINAR